MIEKIVQVQGVGILTKSAPPSIDLRPITTIYAENGKGKSTLSSIFRSLAQGDARALRRRKTAISDLNQAVHIRIDGKSHIFDGSDWNEPFPALLVFDSAFVNANIYAGDSIEPAHRQGLLEFALGADGVDLTNQINELAKRIGELGVELKTLGAELRPSSGPFSVAQFLKLEPSDGAESRLSAAKAYLEDVRNSARLLAAEEFPTLSLPELPTEQLELLLGQTVDDIVESAADRVRTHVEAHLNHHGEQWLRRGTEYMSGDECPFCGQAVEPGETIVDAYKTYFSMEYRDFVGRVSEFRRGIAQEFSDERMDAFHEGVRSALDVATTWNDKLEGIAPPIPSVQELTDAWRSVRQEVMAALDAKMRDPLSADGLSPEAATAIGEFERVTQALDQYHEAAIAANQEIAAHKESLQKSDEVSEVEKVARLTAEAVRGDPDVSTTCNRYIVLDAKKRKLESRKEALREKLNDHTDTVLSALAPKINEILERFSATCRIEDLGVSHVRGTPRTEYALSVHGANVEHQAKHDNDDLAFDVALSDGDKRTLALAFFLARVHTDPNIDDFVIVVDDPVASFDAHRRHKTMDYLLALSSLSSQLILLSHDAPFLRDFHEALASEQDGSLSIELSRTANGSMFRDCDLDQLCRSRYFSAYETLLEYVDSGVQAGGEEKVAQEVRKYLEGNLKARFPTELAGRNTLGKIIEGIRLARDAPWTQGVLPQLTLLSEINSATSPFSHGTDERSPLTDTELEPIVRNALAIGWGIPA